MDKMNKVISRIEVETKPVPFATRYLVGKDGSVYGLSGRPLKHFICNGGYCRLRLRENDGYYRGHGVHRLVASAWIGPIPAGMWINHKNGIKNDNRVENLEITTPQENHRHGMIVLGHRHQVFGTKNGSNKLTEAQVREIKSLLVDGLSHRIIAERFGVSQPMISYIRNGRYWSHLTSALRAEGGAG